MKYLHKFNTKAEQEAAKESPDYIEPWVSVTLEDDETSLNDKISYWNSSANVYKDVIVGMVSGTTTYELEIPEGVTQINPRFFAGTITKLSIPSTVIYIPESITKECGLLTSISINQNNPIYDSRDNSNAIIETATNTLISGCQNTIIPNSVTKIGQESFVEVGIVSVIIPNSVTTIGRNAFGGNPSLRHLTIGESVTSIEEGAFFGCYQLQNLVWNATYLDFITSDSFEVENFENITFGSNVEYIPGQIAKGSKVTSVVIPDSVTEIGFDAFADCNNLTHVIIGNSVAFISSGAFSSGTTLTTLICKATTPPTLMGNVVTLNSGGFIYVPDESVETYKTSQSWSQYASQIKPLSEYQE